MLARPGRHPSPEDIEAALAVLEEDPQALVVHRSRPGLPARGVVVRTTEV